MIVGTYFDGDHGGFAWRQHESYGRALSILIGRCQDHFDAAALMLGVPGRPDWDEQPCDHRVLQVAHDLLAAAWRFRFDPGQLDLLDPVTPTIEGWLDWLWQEVEGWWRYPHLLRQMRIVVDRQNTVAGDAAEAGIARRLIQIHDAVPWLESWRMAIEADYRASSEAACQY